MNNLEKLAILFFALLAVVTTEANAFDEPHADFDARHCEFFVNSLADISFHYGGGGYDEHRLRTFISVNTRDLVTIQGGKIERVGMWVNYDEFPGDPSTASPRYDVKDWIEAHEIEPSYYRVDFTRFILRGFSSSAEHYRREIRGFAYFIVVRRSDGTLSRLWLKDGPVNFTYASVFHGYPVHIENQGPNSYRYVKEPSPIYNQKRSCQH